MSRIISRAESYETIYSSFQNINFAAFDYNTIKRSLLDYVKLYFPENFNDFIESSEFIAVVETFAYIAEQIAYRLDVNAHENFISTAQRRDSILRLAKLVSYTASRPIPARGLVKLSSLSTTESVIDANGNDLANRTIRWNDASNINWKDQFLLVMNRVLEQEFGSVTPSERFQIQDVLFEIYGLNLTSLQSGIFKYAAVVDGQNLPMELVPVTHEEAIGITERRPSNNSNFTLLYGSDGLGDGSETTGFFCLTKQGTLQKYRTSFNGITPNQIFDVDATNVNDTDVWVNGVDASTGATLDLPPLLPYRRPIAQKSGEWVPVDLAYAQNVIFNTNPFRNKYEIETRDNNRIRLIFGDGEFADIPSGIFDVWVRSSTDTDVVIPQASVVNVPSSFTYVDRFSKTQTLTFNFSLINSLLNATASEDIEHVRVTAPAVYYTQDRMVNAEDYNTFPLQDPSILKLQTVNRTFAGDSKYLPWHDASSTYENVKLFGDDGLLYFQEKDVTETTPVVDHNTLISTYLEPLLSSTDVFLQLVSNGVPEGSVRRIFTVAEKNNIVDKLTPPPSPSRIELYFNKVTFTWHAVRFTEGPTILLNWPANYITTPIIRVDQINLLETRYIVTRKARRLVFESQSTAFWNTNDSSNVVDYDTLFSNADEMVVLKANVNYNRTGLLSQNWRYNVLGQEVIDTGVELGLTDIHRLTILPIDENLDRIPDFLNPNEALVHGGVADIFNPKIYYDLTSASGYQIVNVGGAKVGTDATGLVGATTYTATITVNGIARPISILGSTAATFTTLLSEINTDLGAFATASLLSGNIRVTSATTGAASTVAITAGTLFAAPLTGFVAVLTAVPGVNVFPLTITLPILYLTGNGDVTITNVNGTGVTFTEGTPSITDKVIVTLGGTTNTILISVKEYVYFSRPTITDNWTPAELTVQTLEAYRLNVLAAGGLWTRRLGRDNLNFAWLHRSPRYHLVDPSPTNINDMFVITKGYYISLKRWLEEPLALQPDLPTPFDLRAAYGYLLDNKMISDTVVLHPGRIKLLFGSKALPELQANFKIVRSENATLTDNQVKTTIVSTVRNFFDIASWNFGETFYFTELASIIHAALPNEVSSVVLVPTLANHQFGDLFQVLTREDEIFYPDITVSNIEVVSGYTPTNLRLNG